MKKSLIIENLENTIRKMVVANHRADAKYSRRPYPLCDYLAIKFFDLKYGSRAIITDQNPELVEIYRKCGFSVEETFVNEQGIQFYDVTVPTKKFELYRDNGGTLILITFHGRNADYVHTFQTDGLTDLKWCLNDLQRPNCDPSQDWDNNEIDEGVNAVELLEMIDSDREQGNCNFELLADEDGIYPENTQDEEIKAALLN